jgi:hypothetical protein
MTTRASPTDVETQHLEWCVRALAQQPAVQAGLFPSFVCVGDELAGEWEESFQSWKAAGGSSQFCEGEVESLEAIDRQLEAMSGPEHDELWTSESLEHGPEWERVRELAAHALEVLEWPRTPPPPSKATYVGPDA